MENVSPEFLLRLALFHVQKAELEVNENGSCRFIDLEKTALPLCTIAYSANPKTVVSDSTGTEYNAQLLTGHIYYLQGRSCFTSAVNAAANDYANHDRDAIKSYDEAFNYFEKALQYMPLSQNTMLYMAWCKLWQPKQPSGMFSSHKGSNKQGSDDEAIEILKKCIAMDTMTEDALKAGVELQKLGKLY